MTFEEQLETLKASRQFHRKWYAQTYPEVAAQGQDPAEHYLREGARKGYNPGKFFDTAFYLSHYPDVAASGLNPLVHFELIGAAENRVANPARATATGRNAMSPSVPLAAARDGMGQDTGGLGAAVVAHARVDPAGPGLMDRVQDTALSEVAPFLSCIRELCRLIADLDITWQGGVAPHVHDSSAPKGGGGLSGGPAVAVLTSGDSSTALIELARAENPQADIVICAPGGVVRILPAPGPDGREERVQDAATATPGPMSSPGTGPGGALAHVLRAYTHDAPAGMDALIRGIPLTVTGEPFYAGWGFTDDRAHLTGRSRRMDFDTFLASLLFAQKDAPQPEACLQAATAKIIDLHLKVSVNRRFDVPDLAALAAAGAEGESDQDLLARLDRNALAACAAGNWPAFLDERPRGHLTVTTRRLMLEHLAAGAAGAGCRSLPVQRFLAALTCGFALTEGRLDLVVPQVVSLLGSTETARLLVDLARVRGVPPATVLPGWLGTAPEDTGASGLDDLMLAVMQHRPGKGPDEAAALLGWARQCRDGGQLRAARRLLTCYLLTGRCAPEALDMLSDSLWQGFETAAATDALALAARCWPQWRNGYFPARLAQAALTRGDDRMTLHALTGAAGAGAAHLAQGDAFAPLLERRYPGLPVAAALAQIALGDTPDPLERARHLLHMGQAQAAEELLAEGAGSDPDKSAEWAIASSNARALQGQFEPAQALIAQQLDAEQAEGALAPETLFHAMRLASLTGDRNRARDLARRARHGGITPDPALARALDFARGDFSAAMESWRADPVAVLARRHLGGRLCRSLSGLVAGSGATLLVALVDTQGGDIAWTGLFARLSEACKAHKLQITCTPGLIPALTRAFPQIDFVPSERRLAPLPATDDPGALPAAELLTLFDATGWTAVEAADRVALITDLAVDLASTPEAFDPRPCLLPDPDRVAAWRARLADTPQPRIGIAWRGRRTDLPDRDPLDRINDLTPSEIAQLVRESTAGFISLQGPAARADVARIEAACPGRLRAPAELAPELATDPLNDPEEMLALMQCLDVIIACDPEIRALAGALGCRVWYPAPVPANRAWGRVTRLETDYRFATATYVDAPTPGDRAGLMARLLQGIDALHDPDADAGTGGWMDRIEALLATEAEGSEALNHAFRRAIVDAEEALLAPRLDRDTRYWETRARVVEKLGLRAEAALCWGQACAQDRNPDPAHLRAHWIAQVHAGQPDLAERFGPVDPATLPPEALAHVTALRNDHAANALCDEGLRLLAEGQRTASAERFRAAVRASWSHPDHGAALERVVDRMARLDSFTNPAAPRRETVLRMRAIPKLDSYIRHASALDPATHRGQTDTTTGQARSVFCAGYVFSGSGAVVDFLRQSPTVSVPGLGEGDIEPFDTELNILRRFYGLQHLLDMPPERLSIEHLGEFLLGPILGLLAYPSDRYRLDLSRKRSLRGVFETLGRMPDLLDLCDTLLGAAETGRGPDSDIILSAACRVANALPARLARPGRPVVLWNNCIQGWNARVLSVLDRAVMIAVTRDPRDQYASQFYESGDKERTHTLENFIAQTHHHLRLQAQFDQILGLRARILNVRFEDVVTDPGTRKQLLDFAAIPEAGMQEDLYFDPMQSLRNVGIHRTFPDQAAIRRIGAEFPDLLWQG